jgi:hypothetical protein
MHITLIVAYSEKWSSDSSTGNPGTLRKEWCVKLVSQYAPEALINAFGSNWRRSSPFSEYVLERRYIRRGTVEPWTPFQTANTAEQALEYIDDNAISLCDELSEIQRKRRDYADKVKREREQEFEQKHVRDEHEKHLRRSNESFIRLLEGKDAALAHKWNAFVSGADERIRNVVSGDTELMRLHNSVVKTETVSKKRAAIKSFFLLAAKHGLHYE